MDHHISDELLDEFDASLLMLGRHMAARHTGMCEEHPMGAARLLMLRSLTKLGPQRAGDLAQQLGIKAPATSSLIDALEHDGLVAREHSADDRRVVLVSATQKGEAALRGAEREHRERMRSFLSVLSEEDVRTLIRIQRTLIEAMVDRDS